jgi:hypothetical protein
MSLTIGIGCLGWIHVGLLQRAMHFRSTAIVNFAGQLVLAGFPTASGALGALARMAAASLMFFALHAGGVVLPHQRSGLRETGSLVRDLLPERRDRRRFLASVDKEDALAIPTWLGGAKSQSDCADFSGFTEPKS